MSFPEFGEIIEERSVPDFEEFGEIIEKEKISKKNDLGIGSTDRRHLLRSGSRIVESIAGLPGDLASLAQNLGIKGVEKITGKLQPELKKATDILRPLSSEEIKDISFKVFGEKVLPQTEKEQFVDDIISDTAVLALPIKGRVPFLRTIGTALAGNVAAKGAEKLGVGEKGQAVAKMGAFFLSGLVGKGTVKKYWNQQYKLADDAIPKRTMLDTNKLDRQLDKLSRSLKKGGIETPSQKFVEKPLEQLQKSIRNGRMTVEDAVAAKKKINELRSSLFDEVKGKGAQKHARTRINEVANYLDEALEKYGKKNPKFYEHYKAANEAYAGFQQSKKVGNWIAKQIPFGKAGKTSLLLAEALFKPASLKATLPGYALFKGGELLTRMFKNPTLKRFYMNLMKDAIKENQAGFVKNLKGIEKELKKTEPDIYEGLGGK